MINAAIQGGKLLAFGILVIGLLGGIIWGMGFLTQWFLTSEASLFRKIVVTVGVLWIFFTLGYYFLQPT